MKNILVVTLTIIVLLCMMIVGCLSSKKVFVRESMHRYQVKDSLFQSGKSTIVGRVIDRNWNKSPLPDTKIEICSTSYFAKTDLNGNYTISNITPGIYDIKAGTLGWDSHTVPHVKLLADHIIILDFELYQTVDGCPVIEE
jgi:protocatechuate 3,4-dioxygenase beta subunit